MMASSLHYTPKGEDVVDRLGYNPHDSSTTLYQRRAKTNPSLATALPPLNLPSTDGSPQAKRRRASPTTWKLCRKEIIVDGFEKDLQTTYVFCKKEFFKPTYKMFFPTGAIPACGSTATARRDDRGEMFIDLQESVEDIYTNLIKVCPPLRDSLRAGHILKIKTNFYPICADGDSAHSMVYINNESKEVPVHLFETEIDVEQAVFIYPGAISYETAGKCLKVRLGIAPVACNQLDCRFFNPKEDEPRMTTTTELNQLTESFKSLWNNQSDSQPVANFF